MGYVPLDYVPHRIIPPANRVQQKGEAQPKQEFEQPEIVAEDVSEEETSDKRGPRADSSIISTVWR